MFRLKEDNSVINRYGFNSEGHDTVAGRLSHRIRTWLFKNSVATKSGELVPSGVPRSLVLNKALGVNLGKNKISAAEDNSDYVKGVSSLGQFADYIVVNISSPNTPGLPNVKLMKEVKEARDVHVAHRPPILVKIAPDVNEVELEDIAAVVQEAEMDGVIISNTTISRPSYLKSDPTLVSQIGGLSGPPVFPLAVEKIPIIGCGGVSSAEEAIAYAKAGASLVQLYTSLGYYGPGVVYDVKKGLVDYLKKEKTTWKELVGSDHQK
ncbi:FMN-linked oxidoreductase [Rhizoclosmatium globosum]|uniref:Dihydroorotate dehydrogenase (quinone), mitochondrial n=1 Tax=Rhizoclosmatium globosum TaxID=329046 RepID=A0A1Y2BQ19_9FUNG|nr:FMN-linked oxidoreductase [Rhizoclosmatium globosum]|eukprot:ORY36832.1 FMN-linked oxidoreductase [Rhizoclosmatium globosum]